MGKRENQTNKEVNKEKILLKVKRAPDRFQRNSPIRDVLVGQDTIQMQ